MKKKNVLTGLALLPAAAVSAAAVRTALTPVKKSSYVPTPPENRALDYAGKLSEMVRCDTTSHANVQETEKFLAFHQVLEKLFPLVHQHLEKTVIDGNLLFRWPGRDGDSPIVLMSHQDVVPAEGEWTYPRPVRAVRRRGV